MSLGIIVEFLEQGFIYALMALGVYITYKVLDFPDLSVDGTLPLGGAIAAAMLTRGVNPWLALVVAIFAGALAGVFTGLVHVKIGVKDLLSGIITMTALYSINLLIAGSANVPLFTEKSIFSSGVGAVLEEISGGYGIVILVLVLAVACKYILDWYFSTKSGLLLRAVGDNQTFVTYLGRDQGLIKIIGLAISNGLVALCGAILVQQQRSFDISVGTGTIVMGLAMVIIGTNLLRKLPIRSTSMVVIGAILYRAVIAFVLWLGINPMMMKLLTAVLLLLVLLLTRRSTRKGGA